MPLYDFQCPHGHRFEKVVAMAQCGESIPCEGEVPQMQINLDISAPVDTVAPIVPVRCALRATQVIGAHNNPAGMLDHGSSANRDAAREGRYDPLNPSRRFMAKGRGYRK